MKKIKLNMQRRNPWSAGATPRCIQTIVTSRRGCARVCFRRGTSLRITGKQTTATSRSSRWPANGKEVQRIQPHRRPRLETKLMPADVSSAICWVEKCTGAFRRMRANCLIQQTPLLISAQPAVRLYVHCPSRSPDPGPRQPVQQLAPRSCERGTLFPIAPCRLF